MKRLLLLILSIFSVSGVFAATINLVNKTNAPIVAGIIYGSEKKESTIAPGKSDKFNSWLKNIGAVTWKDASGVWNATVNIKALDTEGTVTIYANGKYDIKPCLLCKEVKGQTAFLAKKKITGTVKETGEVVSESEVRVKKVPTVREKILVPSQR